MKKSPHVIWVSPSSRLFYRAKGEVRCRPGSVLPKLSEQGIKINVLIPHDPTLLPKTKLSSSRVTKHTVHLSQNYPIEIIKLTRGSVSPGIYMVKMPALESPIASAVLSKSAIALAQQLKRPVDIFHIFNWETALLPLFLEIEKNGSRIFKDTRTFLNVGSLKEQGNFAPAVLNYLGIPKTLFHPDGIEFFGKVSFLKSGLLFSDGVGLIENSLSSRGSVHRNGTGMEGVLDTMMPKLRRWASERSLRSHLDAYTELMASPKSRPLLPQMVKKLHVNGTQAQTFIDSWGPPPPERYDTNSLGFLIQSPIKAYVFWEWASGGINEYGLFIENRSKGTRQLLSRGLSAVSDFWLEVEPDQEYLTELVGWDQSGRMHALLRSRLVRTPRVVPSANRNAVFIDVRNWNRFLMTGMPAWDDLWALLKRGGSSAWEWVSSGLPSSLRLG